MQKHLPNLITLIRIALAPIIAFLLWQPPTITLSQCALALFCFAGLSDWLDGWLARRLNIVSSVGRMLDPIADKLLIAACLFAFAAQRGQDILFLIPALVILFREFLVSGLREYLAGSTVTVPVSLAAKWKTAIQMTAIGCLIAGPGLPAFDWLDMAGVILLWISALLTVQTGLSYFQASSSHFKR
jgi:cardiolipin synthase